MRSTVAVVVGLAAGGCGKDGARPPPPPPIDARVAPVVPDAAPPLDLQDDPDLPAHRRLPATPWPDDGAATFLASLAGTWHLDAGVQQEDLTIEASGAYHSRLSSNVAGKGWVITESDGVYTTPAQHRLVEGRTVYQVALVGDELFTTTNPGDILTATPGTKFTTWDVEQGVDVVVAGKRCTVTTADGTSLAAKCKLKRDRSRTFEVLTATYTLPDRGPRTTTRYRVGGYFISDRVWDCCHAHRVRGP